jgi:hypothetical protein
MSKFMKKYDVKIKAKLQNHPVELTIPVDISVMAAATTAATEKASNMNLQEVEFLSVTERPPEYEQLELDFGKDDCCENEDSCEDEEFDNESSSYTPYTRHPTQTQTPKSEYTSYASQMKQKTEDSLPPTYTPRVNNSYTPYKTRVVSVDSKYTKYDFK